MSFPVFSEQTPIRLRPFAPRPAAFAYRDPALDAKLNLIIGSVRSAKTWSLHPKVLQLCEYPVAGQRLFTGVTKQSIYTNVLTDLFELIDLSGPGGYHYNRQTGELRLFDSKWICIGAKDEGSEKYLRGSTVGIAVGDELSLMPRSFFMMLLSRMSPKGSRLYGTSNSDSPYHYLKKDVLDNPDYSKGLGKDLWTETWTFADNPTLTPDYIDWLKRSYTGIWYRRFVLAEWCLTEGAVYRDVLTEDVFYVNKERPVGLRGRNGHIEHWISIDYGTTNPCVFLEIFDDGRVVWWDREYYFDSQVARKQKTDSEYADDLMVFIGAREAGKPTGPDLFDRRAWPGVLIDPSAASLKTELVQRGFYVMDAKNDVKDGIRRLATMLSRKKIRINEQGCPKTVEEMQTYAWDEKAARRGEEQPLKTHDHGPDAGRYHAETRINDWRLATA